MKETKVILAIAIVAIIIVTILYIILTSVSYVDIDELSRNPEKYVGKSIAVKSKGILDWRTWGYKL